MTAKRPAHRPALPPEQRLEVVALRLSAAQRDKLARLGGATWVRRTIDKAREPREQAAD